MKSDPKQCLYCQNNETLHNLMIEIAQLSVSRVFIFKENTGKTFRQHITDMRIGYACKLLLNGKWNITTIRELCISIICEYI